MTAFESFVNGCWIAVSVLMLACIALLVVYGVWQALDENEAEKDRERERGSAELKFDTMSAWEMNYVTRRLLRADRKKSKRIYSRLMSR